MSRRYRIEITPNTDTATSSTPVNSSGFTTASSTGTTPDANTFGFVAKSSALPAPYQTFFPLDVLPDGQNVNTSYLDVEFDLNSNSNGTVNQGSQMLTIKGVTPQMVANVSQLNNMNITVYGGFAKGMPLATAMATLGFNPIVKGQIYGAFGNWVGTDIYICLPILPNNGVGVLDSNGVVETPNLTINGKKGEQWQAVITRSLQQLMPNSPFVVDVSPKLILPDDHQGTAYTLDALAQRWTSESLAILGNTNGYLGIRTNWNNGVLYVTDNPQVKGSKTVTLKVEQLLCNPVWVDIQTLQVITPMRSDIYMNDTLNIPQNVLALAPSTAATGQAAIANTTTIASLSGLYTVTGVRHLGRARSPQALEWASIFTLTYSNGAVPADQQPVTDGTQPYGT